ncbi:unnamed protein product (mitochondrion) [Plasmodiophora brassicae]|uniref:Uncharacterized protein n=1 Tax=Plasmodiophora brassicae TaxID=37360 RepID=A0A3P3Y8J0_PLABS|nr:unnamed protein product [Plasmodiophora brassicae]
MLLLQLCGGNPLRRISCLLDVQGRVTDPADQSRSIDSTSSMSDPLSRRRDPRRQKDAQQQAQAAMHNSNVVCGALPYGQSMPANGMNKRKLDGGVGDVSGKAHIGDDDAAARPQVAVKRQNAQDTNNLACYTQAIEQCLMADFSFDDVDD